jgi:DNA-binding XRE family transcriptional regulator
MNRKHLGSSFEKDAKEWKKDRKFHDAVEEHKEKAKLAALLRTVREKESLTQTELAKRAHVSQSVIARMEASTSKSLPRIDLFNKVLSSVGYQLTITAKGRHGEVRVAF